MQFVIPYGKKGLNYLRSHLVDSFGLAFQANPRYNAEQALFTFLQKKTIKMSLEKRISQDLKTAMKAKDDVAKRAIRAIKSAILLKKTDGSGKEITEADEIKMVQKLVKQRQDSLAIYEKEGREDLAQTEREEIEALKVYLPEQLSEAELEAVVREVVAQTGATSMKDMGKVMGAASKRLAGKADGKSISVAVKKILAS